MRIFNPRKAEDFESYLRLQANIVDIIGGYVKLSKRGNRYVARCPFHPDGVDKELQVYPDRSIFMCWSAGCSSGDVFDFAAKVENVSRIEAINILAHRLNIRSDLIDETPQVSNKLKISFSMLKTFQQCPLRYKYRYIGKKRDQKTTGYLSVGRILHRTLAEFFGKSPAPRKLDTLLDMLAKFWNSSGFQDKGDEEESKFRVEEMLINYFNAHDCNVEVWRVEAPIKYDIEDIQISGVVDRIDKLETGTYEIIDYKTEPIIAESDNKIQLAFYYYGVTQLYQLPVSKLTLEYLPSKESISIVPTEDELLSAIDFAVGVARQIQNTIDFKPSRNLYCADCVLVNKCPEFIRKGD